MKEGPPQLVNLCPPPRMGSAKGRTPQGTFASPDSSCLRCFLLSAVTYDSHSIQPQSAGYCQDPYIMIQIVRLPRSRLEIVLHVSGSKRETRRHKGVVWDAVACWT